MRNVSYSQKTRSLNQISSPEFNLNLSRTQIHSSDKIIPILRCEKKWDENLQAKKNSHQQVIYKHQFLNIKEN